MAVSFAECCARGQMPAFTVNRKFLMVDRLIREGKVVLRYQNRSEYVIVQPEVAGEWSRKLSGAATGTME